MEVARHGTARLMPLAELERSGVCVWMYIVCVCVCVYMHAWQGDDSCGLVAGP